MFAAIGLLACLFLSFLYRFRGGGFVTTNSDTLCRLSWGLGLQIVFFFCMLPVVNWWFLFLPLLLGYAMMLIPHAFAQNYQNNRLASDMWGMAWVGAARGAILFAPYALLTSHYVGAALGTFIVAAGQPFAYLLGWHFPLNYPSLSKNSTEWGEFFTGAVWGLAIISSVLV